jgi:acyl carrier protein
VGESKVIQGNKGYESKVLNMVLNQYLDEIIPVSHIENSLQVLEANPDKLVWDLATRIYKESGYKVEFYTVLDVINTRIKAIEDHLANEEKIRQVAEKEACLRNKINDVLEEFGGNESQAKIFVRTREIISNQLGLDEDEVDEETQVFTCEFYKGGGWLSSSPPERITSWSYKAEESSSYRKVISTELGDEFDATEILMALEQEFDVEIPESDAEDLDTFKKVVDYIAQKKAG